MAPRGLRGVLGGLLVFEVVEAVGGHGVDPRVLGLLCAAARRYEWHCSARASSNCPEPHAAAVAAWSGVFAAKIAHVCDLMLLSEVQAPRSFAYPQVTSLCFEWAIDQPSTNHIHERFLCRWGFWRPVGGWLLVSCLAHRSLGWCIDLGVRLLSRDGASAGAVRKCVLASGGAPRACPFRWVLAGGAPFVYNGRRSVAYRARGPTGAPCAFN